MVWYVLMPAPEAWLANSEGPGNSRFAYISVSRASLDAQTFTNDATKLAENLGRDVSKASVLEMHRVQSPSDSTGLETQAAFKKVHGTKPRNHPLNQSVNSLELSADAIFKP